MEHLDDILSKTNNWSHIHRLVIGNISVKDTKETSIDKLKQGYEFN